MAKLMKLAIAATCLETRDYDDALAVYIEHQEEAQEFMTSLKGLRDLLHNYEEALEIGRQTTFKLKTRAFKNVQEEEQLKELARSKLQSASTLIAYIARNVKRVNELLNKMD